MAVVETKVKASTAAAAVSGLALWALGRYVFKGSVPDVVVSWVYVLVPGLLAWGAGYWAPHTPRALPPLPASAYPPGATPLPPGYPASKPPMSALPPNAAESARIAEAQAAQKTLQPPPGAGM